MASDLYGYLYYWIAQPPAQPPPTFWVEWSFRSNHPLGIIFYDCDVYFSIHVLETHDVTFMYGDAAISFSGDIVIEGLDIQAFHMYRMESVDGVGYRISVDGLAFVVDSGLGSNGYHYMAFGGFGGCIGDWIPNMRNEWDSVRYGTIGFGERIVGAEPVMGFLEPQRNAEVSRIVVTWDSPNYAYIDDITVEVTCDCDETCPAAPVVIATKRLDNGPSDVLEIVLDRPLPPDARTVFTFHEDNPDPNVIDVINTVSYTFQRGDVNADGQWNLRDFAALQSCFGASSLAPTCSAFDYDAVSTIDSADVVSFVSDFLNSGP